MSNKKLSKMLKYSGTLIITPNMTSDSVVSNGLPYAISLGYRAQYDVSSYVNYARGDSGGTILKFPIPILVTSYQFGSVGINAYNVASGYLALYLNGSQVFNTTNINSGASGNVGNILADTVKIAATNSAAYANEGILGSIDGCNLTGLIL